MDDVLIIDLETGGQKLRPMTAAEKKQQAADAADAAAREQAESGQASAAKAQSGRAVALAKKARAGSLTAAERDEALALLLEAR